jgi:hypothetical protein
MMPDKLVELIYRNWAVVMTAPVPFAAALILGCVAGWLAAWLILKQRLQHHRELIDHYKDVLAEKAPNTLATPAKRGRNAAMGLGVTLFVIGLIAISLGSAIIYNISVASAPPQISKTSADKSARKAQLQKFYLEGGELLARPIPKDISEQDFKKYEDDCNAWLTRTVNWIGENMGDAAKGRFMDTSGYLSFSYPNAANAEHGKIIGGLNNFRKNLQVLIVEFDAWDSKS